MDKQCRPFISCLYRQSQPAQPKWSLQLLKVDHRQSSKVWLHSAGSTYVFAQELRLIFVSERRSVAAENAMMVHVTWEQPWPWARCPWHVQRSAFLFAQRVVIQPVPHLLGAVKSKCSWQQHIRCTSSSDVKPLHDEAI